jgi:hypothetical protein
MVVVGKAMEMVGWDGWAVFGIVFLIGWDGKAAYLRSWEFGEHP